MIGNLVYDVGMNNGDDTAYYLNRGFRVVAIEANPILAEQVSKRFEREISSGDLTILNVGISDGEGDLPFWICNGNSEWSSFDPTIASRDGVDHHQINISCRRFRSILEEFGTPYYLKLDIEGNEIYCLQDLIGVDLPKYVSLEKTVRAVESLNLLHNLGYTGFKLISQFNFLPLEYPPTREQKRYEMLTRLLESRKVVIRAVRRAGARGWLERQIELFRSAHGWSFPPGTSGPFGEDLPGKWQSHEEIVETLENADHSRDRGDRSPFWNNKDYSFWADFHAVRQD